MNQAQGRPNRLIAETSPYLLQHAHNPVDWHPWNAEALDRARREDKPILLSVGYSACHWCHVMAHESFEDEATAQVMNQLFVCIKVDREERPDLDKIYQIAHQMLAQRAGGWPLTMFLTPDDHTPFFGGTYFPKEPRYGMPAFADLLQRVADYYRQHRDELRQQNTALKQAFDRLQPSPSESDVALKPELLQAARDQLEQQFDSVHGGFGSAPKFPHPASIERCLRHWAASAAPGGGRPDDKSLAMARYTLQKMAAGGIYDHLGGGFCRYAVDAQWMIPHFEKMLYDNGPLLALYAQAALATDDGFFRRIALETGDWVQREMQSPEGGYYSSLDADSEGHEGRFYVWTREEVQALLSEEEYRVLAAHYGLEQPPNFEQRWWHLYVNEDLDAVAQKLGLSEQRAIVILSAARQRLFAARGQRVRPGRDEKILTSWNGLMIKGMAAAGRLLERPDFIASAGVASDFIYTHLWQQGRLRATYKDGKAHLNAYLDDYAFMLDGMLELLQARWRTQDLEFCRALADVVLERFEDPQDGGFYFTADDHEKLLYRLKPSHDESIPSGNGVVAQALLRLGHLLAENRYLEAAERTLKALYADAARYPAANNTLLHALEEYLNPPQLIVLRGEPELFRPWVQRCLKYYAPRRMVFAIPADVQTLPEVLAARVPHGAVTAYVCTGHTCSAPITDLPTLERTLPALEAARK